MPTLLNPTRRQLASGLALASTLGWWCLPAQATAPDARRTLRDSAPLMGTRVDILIDDMDATAGAPALAAAWAEMRRLAEMMSRYRPGNPVDLLNEAAGRHPVPVPREMMAVLLHAQAVSRRTRGAFDITVGSLAGWRFDTAAQELPTSSRIARELLLVGARGLHLDPTSGAAFLRRPGMRIDLGGIAKLPILQAGMDALRRQGVRGAMVNGGGDVLLSARSSGEPWRIGLRDPAEPQRLLAVLPIDEGLVASSGDYERCVVRDGRRYHHILDPATGYPTQAVHGVSLVGAKVDEVNGLGAAAMVMGAEAGAALLAGTPARQALLVRQDGRVWVSPALGARLLPPPGQDRVRGLA